MTASLAGQVIPQSQSLQGAPVHSTDYSVQDLPLHTLALTDSASSLPSRLSQPSVSGRASPLATATLNTEGTSVPSQSSLTQHENKPCASPGPPPSSMTEVQSATDRPVPSTVSTPSMALPAGPPGGSPMGHPARPLPPEPPRHMVPLPSQLQSLPPRPPGHFNGSMRPLPPHWGHPGTPDYNGHPLPYPPSQKMHYPQPYPRPVPELASPYPPQESFHRQTMYAGNMPPMRPPPSSSPWRRSFHANMVPDSSYMPDSSLLAASIAGRRGKQNQFPPPTKENLAMFRAKAEESNDPQKHLDLAKFLLEAIPQICATESDPKRAQKAMEVMNAEAQRIVKKLASQSGLGKSGFAEAQFFLANCYSKGMMGLDKDHDKAFALYMQGSKQNHPACTYRVAVCYEVGAGTKRDKAHAIQFYRKAANLGDPSAMYKLGMILLKGLLGQSKNPPEGISWLKRATLQPDEDHPHAFHELGLAFEKEGVPSVIPDVDYARDLFTQAALFGYAPSQFKLGLAYENGFLNCPVDPHRSIAWYSKAAEQGHLESELSLSGWYLTGAEGILKQSDHEAYLWARKAADKGYAKAEYAVGYYTESGIGVVQNLEEAKKWYQRAAAQNNRRAIQRLAELKKAGANRPQQRHKHARKPNGQPDSKDGDCVIM